MLRIIKRLIIYNLMRLVLAITSLFSGKRELLVILLAFLVLGAFLPLKQGSKNEQLLEQAGTGDAETVTQVVEDGAWLSARDEFGRSALHVAARYSNVDAVKALLEMKADVLTVDFRNRTPLHMQRYDGSSNTEIIRLLLAAGADPLAKDYKGRTPLDILEGQLRYNEPARNLLRKAMAKASAAAPTPAITPEDRKQAE